MRDLLPSRPTCRWGTAALIRPLCCTLLTFAVLGGTTVAARAFSLEVTPTVVALGAGRPTQLLTLRNLGQEEVRLEVSVAAWDQKPNGETVLTPTDDLISFPGLLSIPAGGESKVRVGTTVPPGTIEKTYRLKLEELPNLTKATRGYEIQVLTTQSIPIFIEPADQTINGRIEDSAFAHGALSFTVRNTGARHFVAQTVRVTGFDAAEREVFNRSTKGWYILAGGTRNYELPLGRNDCLESRRFLIEVETPGRTFKQDFNPPRDGCDMPDIARTGSPDGLADTSPVSVKPPP